MGINNDQYISPTNFQIAMCVWAKFLQHPPKVDDWRFHRYPQILLSMSPNFVNPDLYALSSKWYIMIYHDISWYIMIYLILSHKTSQFGWLNPLFLVKSPFVCYLANMHFKHPRIPEAFLWSPKAWQWSSSWKRSSRDLTWDGITQIPLLIE